MPTEESEGNVFYVYNCCKSVYLKCINWNKTAGKIVGILNKKIYFRKYTEFD